MKLKKIDPKEKIVTFTLTETLPQIVTLPPIVTNSDKENEFDGMLLGEKEKRAVLSSVQLHDGMAMEERKKRNIESVTEKEKERGGGAPVKYIGETSRSAYERLKEHFKDLKNISVKSHMLKH